MRSARLRPLPLLFLLSAFATAAPPPAAAAMITGYAMGEEFTENLSDTRYLTLVQFVPGTAVYLTFQYDTTPVPDRVELELGLADGFRVALPTRFTNDSRAAVPASGGLVLLVAHNPVSILVRFFEEGVGSAGTLEYAVDIGSTGEGFRRTWSGSRTTRPSRARSRGGVVMALTGAVLAGRGRLRPAPPHAGARLTARENHRYRAGGGARAGGLTRWRLRPPASRTQSSVPGVGYRCTLTSLPPRQIVRSSQFEVLTRHGLRQKSPDCAVARSHRVRGEGCKKT